MISLRDIIVFLWKTMIGQSPIIISLIFSVSFPLSFLYLFPYLFHGKRYRKDKGKNYWALPNHAFDNVLAVVKVGPQSKMGLWDNIVSKDFFIKLWKNKLKVCRDKKCLKHFLFQKLETKKDSLFLLSFFCQAFFVSFRFALQKLLLENH